MPQPQCAYNASKAGVRQLVKSLAVEWAQKNVRVNSISPGYIGTDLDVYKRQAVMSRADQRLCADKIIRNSYKGHKHILI